jgi:hypothetical protein
LILFHQKIFVRAHLPGLQIGTAYEARVSYFTDCNTMSEASDPSKPCLPAQGKDDVPGTVPHSVPVTSSAPAAPPAPVSVSSGPNEGVGENVEGSVDKR